MGNAHIWWQPEGRSTQVKIDLGRRLRSRGGPFVQYTGAHSEALGGASTSVIYGGRMDVSIGLTWQRTSSDWTDEGSGLARKLWALQAHLKRGGSCTFVEDITYAWATFADRTPEEATSVIALNTPTITNTLAPGVSPLNREVYINTDPDLYITEHHLCSAFTPNHLTVSGSLKELYDGARWVLVREAGTYPAMRVPEPQRRQNFLRNRDGRVFDLDLPLEEDPSLLESLARSGGELADEADSPVGVDLPGADWDEWVGGGSGSPTGRDWSW